MSPVPDLRPAVRRRPTAPGLALLIAVSVSSACTLGPEPRRPATVVDPEATFVHADERSHRAGTLDDGAEPAQPIDPWWIGFGDEPTRALVREALVHNTDLRAAAARVLEARAQLGRVRGSQLPQVTAGVSASRTKSSFNLPEAGRVQVYSTTYSTDLGVSYQVDLFGRLRRSKQAAWADVLAREAARDIVRHTVIAETVRARVRISTAHRALALAREIRDSWQRTLETIERRYGAGLVSALDLRLARENLASAEAAAVLVEQQLRQSHLGLDVLLGRRPGTGDELDALLSPLPDLDPVPLGLPAQLLDRRPDLRQAEMQLAAATARIGVAMADLFPSLTLSGSTGTASDVLSDLLSSEALVYNALANLLAPIFDGGQRRAEVDAARARAEQASAAYAGVILSALREVEDALVRDTATQKRLQFLDQRLEEARAADRIARERYQRGVEPLLQVLDAERRLRQAENALLDARGELWNTRIDLYLALGGDWLNDAELALVEAAPSEEPSPNPDRPAPLEAETDPTSQSSERQDA